nr:reverse transcriptase domain-containing protein [Tanacetum cinerariifolium]
TFQANSQTRASYYCRDSRCHYGEYAYYVIITPSTHRGLRRCYCYSRHTCRRFELKVGLLQLVTSSQFHGFERDDPHAHIRWFNKITSMLKYKNVPNDAIKLMPFPFSLEKAAQTWLEKEHPRSIHTWEDLVSKFVNYFFPPSKTTNLKNDITGFQQKFKETFSEALDRFKDLLAGGILLNRTPRDALTIIENKSKVRTSRNKLLVSKVKTTTSSSPSSKIIALTDMVVERDTEPIKDKVQATSLESTTHVQPSVFQVLIPEPNVAPKPNHKSSIPYPSSLNDQKFQEKTNSQMLESCNALADLGASISLMPFSLWKKLSLPDLTSTRMTLELATRSFAYPTGIDEDIFVRPFLRTDRDEQLIFHAGSTSKHPHNHGNGLINMINFIDITCEDRFPEVLKFKKSNHPLSGSTTPLSDSSPSLTPFETSDSL